MRLTTLLPWILAGAIAGPAAAFTTEFAGEFHLAADLDGDGREDVVIVDRETGSFRVGYQLAPGVHTFAQARASGIGEVSSVSSGRLLSLARDSLVLTSPWANRLNLVEAPAPATAVPPVSVYPAGIGPEQVLAIDVGGAGNTAHLDLISLSSQNSPPNQDRRSVIRWDGSAASAIENVNLPAEFRGLNKARLIPGGQILAGVLQRNVSDYTLRLDSLQTGTNVPVATAAGFGSRFVYGQFVAAALNHYLSYNRGESNVVVRALSQPIPGNYVFGAAASHSLGRRISSVTVLQSSPVHRLLVIYAGDSEAGIFSFNGVSAPVLAQPLVAPAGTEFTGALALGNGEFHLFNGAAGSGRSTGFQQFQQSGANYTLKTSGNLPAPNPLGTAANVFLFANEPFVSDQPNLLRSLNGADWVSGVNLGGADVIATAERFGTSAQGLQSPAARNLGAKPAGANFALINQFRGDISVASFLPAIGDESGDISITPNPGPQLRAIVATISTRTPGALFWYRRGPGESWSLGLGSASLTLFRNTTVEFYADPASAPRSRIHRARYTFPDPPAQQDSDDDGVPDFVELAKGMDPNGGNDSDGDGSTDRDELFAGTNPNSTNSVPAGKLEEFTSFDLVATPRGYDGTVPGEAALGPNLEIGIHDLTGNLLDRRPTVLVPAAIANPAIVMRDAPADVNLGLLALGTDSHFRIATASPDKLIGREVLGLVPIPVVDPVEFVFTPGPGDLLGQADAWVAAAKAALGALPSVRVVTRFGPMETLGALLLERKVHEIFVARGKPGLVESNAITLFPHRPGDVLRTSLTATDLQSLRQFGPGGLPAWNLASMHLAISNALPDPPTLQLRRLALDVYRISSLSNNAAPGKFPLPVDVLRQFIATGILHSNYAAATALLPAELTSASAGSTALLAAIKPRPVVNLDLVVTPATFDGDCVVLQTVPGGLPRNLFSAPRVPFKFPDSFEIMVGSMIRVRAFSDLEESCPGTSLEVLSAQLLSVPPVELVDVDGDLLPDSWECVFLGGDGDPDGDEDGDGINNLQESLDGTDPADNIYKALAKVDLSPPFIDIKLLGPGAHKLSWKYPAGYADLFEFDLLYTDVLGGAFGPSGVAPTRLPGGEFELDLELADEGNRFYQLVQRLR